MPSLVKKGEFAALMGVGASAVSNWGKKGLLVFGEDPESPGRQLVDVEKSQLLIRGTIDQTRGRPTSASRTAAEQPDDTAGQSTTRTPVLSPAEQLRQEEARERILSRRIENEKSVGGLVSLAEYERKAGEHGRKAREGTHGVVRQLAERLAAESDPRVIVSLLLEKLDKMFANLADDIEAEDRAEQVADATLAAVEMAEAAVAGETDDEP